jgi:hypothetical protein
VGSLKDKLIAAGIVSAEEAARAEAKAKRAANAEKKAQRAAEVAAIREQREHETAPFRNQPTTDSAASLIATWRAFETRANDLGFGWALGKNSKDVHWDGAKALHAPGWDRGFPEIYRAFVEQADYPTLGFRYYCRDGFSFLPPEPMAAVSAIVSDDEREVLGRTPKSEGPCRYRFFAGIELSDLDGWAFSADPRDPPGLVWNVVSAMVHEPLGMFDTWLTEKLARLTAQMEATSEADRVALEKNHDSDPHRVLDYAKILGNSEG